ncbi:hypothetical protein FIBSPDRAFT_850582 [Athelia psychrophila]|uniref:F-box domain-containing protein n=1 Tax=Athelia psychrophila TaxID=1759441 RepID=A0A166T7Q3_9AGAM|nr:hypothetical protein FIBSPDRAFT_850582 [Fibularhizoctonia sp. CBS 109695]
MSPAASLPDELLVHVFKHAYDQAPLYGPPFAHIVSQVSHKWRQLATSTSSLWSIVVLNHSLKPEFLALILARNQSAPLELYIDLRPPKLSLSRIVIKERVYAHLPALLVLSARWGALSILTDRDDDTVTLLSAFMPLHTPLLIYFEVHVERHTRSEFPVAPAVRLFTRGAERLRVVDLDGLPLRAAWPPLGAVRTLALDLSCTSMTCTDFVCALEEMPRLQSLTINNYNFDLPPPPAAAGAPDARVRFHSATLQTLSVVSLRSDEDFIARFWSIVSFPALETLSLTCHNDEDIPVFAKYARFPALRALKLNHTQDTTHMGDLAAKLPLLERLSVHWCPPEAILHELLPANPPSRPGIRGMGEASWPRLHTLSLSNFDGGVMTLLDAIVDYKKTTPWPLRKLRVAAVDLDQLRGREFEVRGVTVEMIN